MFHIAIGKTVCETLISRQISFIFQSSNPIYLCILLHTYIKYKQLLTLILFFFFWLFLMAFCQMDNFILI